MSAPVAPARFPDYLELTKPRLSLLSVLTAMVGYFAARPPSNPLKLTLLLIGTCLAAGGVAALNQWMESDTDARMKRTADRPIPTGKVPSGSAFVLGWLPVQRDKQPASRPIQESSHRTADTAAQDEHQARRVTC